MTTLPVGLDVVRSTEKLDLPGARRQSLYHAVDLIRFVAGGADLQKTCIKEPDLYSRLHSSETLPQLRSHHSPILC